MRKLLVGLLAHLSLASAAIAQVPNFPQTLPPNTVVGRLGIGPGPAQAIPISTLQSAINGCANNFVGCLSINLPAFTPHDNITWPQSYTRIGSQFTNAGTGVVGSANQWLLNLQMELPGATSSAANYEKGAIFAHCLTADPSSALIARDCVGADIRGEIRAGNLTGSAFGVVPGCYMEALADGSCTGVEVDVYHSGVDQPAYNTATSKMGILVVCSGAVNCTAGFVIPGGASKWHKAFVANPQNLVPIGTDANAAFLELTNLWRVKPDGVLTQTISSGGIINTFQSSAGGGITNVWGNLPATGANFDNITHSFNFATTTGVQFTGGQMTVQMPVATNASQTTILSFFNVNAGGALTERWRMSQTGGLAVGSAAVTIDPGAGALILSNATFMLRTAVSWTNGAAAAAGTLTNAPAAGNPTKWIAVDDNGTTRRIPAW